LSGYDTSSLALNIFGTPVGARRQRASLGAGAPAATTPAPAVPGSPPVVFGVTPVEGTEAARAAKVLQAAAAQARPHILLDPDLASRPADQQRGMPKGMSAQEVADGICATILQGSGPILLVVPGTLGVAYQSSMLATARALIAASKGAPLSVASIPYPNGIPDIATRFLRIGVGEATNVLALVLKKLKAAAPHRPILLAGESQGAWLTADTLRADPALAAAVTRVALFAKPGFAQLPPPVGAARLGAAMLPGSPTGASGIIEWRHTDDIVPSLFAHLGLQVAGGFVDAIQGWIHTKDFEYVPHHYDLHGPEAAKWLLEGIAPSNPVHHSKSHPTVPPTI